MKHLTLVMTFVIGGLGLTGCGGWLTRESVPTPAKPIITLRDIHSIGTPVVTVETTSIGWQVTAQQPIERTEVEERAVSERVQRTLFFPPALFAGLLQCPIGGLTWMLTLGTYGHELATHGCWRLLMIETLPGAATMTSETIHTTHTVVDTEPLRGAIVHLTNPQQSERWTGSLSLDGTLLIPYSVIAKQSTEQPPQHLTIQRNLDTIWSGDLPAIPKTESAKPTLKSWPKTLVFQIEESKDRDAAVLRPVQQAIQHALLRDGHCVVVGDMVREQLRDEVVIEQAELTRKTISIPSLHFIPTTVLIRTEKDVAAGHDQIQISWFDVERGQIIETVTLKISLKLEQQHSEMKLMVRDRVPKDEKCPT